MPPRPKPKRTRSSAKPAPRFDYVSAIRAEKLRRAARLRLLTQQSGITAEEANARQSAEAMLCRGDFFRWAENWAVLADPKSPDPLLRKPPLILWPRQRDYCWFLLKGALGGDDRWINKSREIGATWLACVILHWLAWTQQGFSALAMSRVESLVDDRTPASIFGKLRFTIQAQPSFLKPGVEIDTYMKLVYSGTGGTILGESTNTGAGRSTRHTVVLRDEWAHVDHHIQRRIALALESVAFSNWVLSTPNGSGEDFYVNWELAPAANKLEIPWAADPRRTPEWYEKLLRKNGGRLTWDEREQEYNCSFSAVSGLRIFKADKKAITYGAAERARLEKAPGLFTVGAMDFGSGPSWTALLVARVQWEEEGQRYPKVWIGAELVAQRQGARDIAARGVEALKSFPIHPTIVGDPAGRAADSMQESWESNLNAAGLPVVCLPASYNDADVISQTLDEVQEMLDAGRLLIDEECKLLLKAIDHWEWDVPAGVQIELVNRKMVSPKKNAWSHLGDALRYLVGVILRTPPQAKVTEEEAQGLTHETEDAVLDDVYDRAMGGWR